VAFLIQIVLNVWNRMDLIRLPQLKKNLTKIKTFKRSKKLELKVALKDLKEFNL